ncbi:MAG: pantothenate kinase [Leptolyngbya sp.]|nr:pantothenate kinase [Leptolyngbya sp.]
MTPQSANPQSTNPQSANPQPANPQSTNPQAEDPWLGLVVGNSRLHWAAFAGTRWLGTWHTPHGTPAQGQALIEAGFAEGAWEPWAVEAVEWAAEAAKGRSGGGRLPLPWRATPPQLWLASVVQDQGAIWATYPRCTRVTTDQVPLKNRYPTLGVDRALALVGAGDVYGWPVLVVDGGTALTLTAGADQGLVGGAILPGLRAQFRALHDYTDGLPLVVPALASLPPRWATTTAEAMVSGVVYGQLAGLRDFIADWRQHSPQGRVVFTGGDGATLATALIDQTPPWQDFLHIDAALMFWGLRVCRQQGQS